MLPLIRLSVILSAYGSMPFKADSPIVGSFPGAVEGEVGAHQHHFRIRGDLHFP